jgi:TonB-dependent starch-binding outer membrane protein SusC
MRRTATLAIILTLAPAALSAQSGKDDRHVAGILLPREAGVPFAGAAIRIVGTDRMVCADRTGRFRIDLPAGEARLRITPVGFSPFEVMLEHGANQVELPLVDHVVMLEGVEVMGYATVPQSANAETRLTAADLGNVPAQTVESKLQGKIAGAEISANSGAPGGGFAIAFRGVKTILGDANPVIVVDGAIVSNASLPTGTSFVTGSPESENPVNRLADLNPNDIETIEVLRGPSAAAKYGAHAGNGVVIITTKRGVRRSEKSDATEALRCFRPTGS